MTVKPVSKYFRFLFNNLATPSKRKQWFSFHLGSSEALGTNCFEIREWRPLLLQVYNSRIPVFVYFKPVDRCSFAAKRRSKLLWEHPMSGWLFSSVTMLCSVYCVYNIILVSRSVTLFKCAVKFLSASEGQTTNSDTWRNPGSFYRAFVLCAVLFTS